MAILLFQKINLHSNIINKTQKNRENSTTYFQENYVAKVEVLRVSTGFQFFLNKFLKEGFVTYFS